MIDNYFTKLNSVKCKTEDKNNLTYVSWSDAWAEVKKQYADSNYTIYENQEWYPFWESKFWIDVKVWVTINSIEHIVRLPVLDGANKAQTDKDYTYEVLDYQKTFKDYKWNPNQVRKYMTKTCKWANQFDINKAIMRAFAKAIAMHWIGLYVYRWEDLPEEILVEKELFTEEIFEEMKKKTNYKDYFEAKSVIEKKYDLDLKMAKIVKKYYEDKDKWVEMNDDGTPPF